MDHKDLLNSWQVGTRIAHMAHHRTAAYYARMQKAVGISVVILTTTAGTTIISQLGEASQAGQAAVGLLSLAATVLAALQTFMNFEGRAEQHRAAGLNYGMLRRRIEVVLAEAKTDTPAFETFIKAFRNDWDAADNAAPILPQRFYDQAKAAVAKSMEDARKRSEQNVSKLQ